MSKTLLIKVSIFGLLISLLGCGPSASHVNNLQDTEQEVVSQQSVVSIPDTMEYEKSYKIIAKISKEGNKESYLISVNDSFMKGERDTETWSLDSSIVTSKNEKIVDTIKHDSLHRTIVISKSIPSVRKIIISENIKLQLISDDNPDDFIIQPETSELQSVFDTTKWTWNVIPKSGRTGSTLTVYATVLTSTDGTTPNDPLSFRIYSRTIYVFLPWYKALWRILGDNTIQFIFTALLIPVFTWIIHNFMRVLKTYITFIKNKKTRKYKLFDLATCFTFTLVIAIVTFSYYGNYIVKEGCWVWYSISFVLSSVAVYLVNRELYKYQWIITTLIVLIIGTCFFYSFVSGEGKGIHAIIFGILQGGSFLLFLTALSRYIKSIKGGAN